MTCVLCWSSCVDPEFILPQWPAPLNVCVLVTTRLGGVSAAPWDSLNLGDHVGDEPAHVTANRSRLRFHLPSDPVWLRQVHGRRCIDATVAADNEADAAFARQVGTVCAVLTADCLPILLCDRRGSVVAAAHAGWRGLAAGVIESAITAMAEPGGNLIAWLGPAIGPDNFEVGDEVRTTFVDHSPAAAIAFRPCASGKWLCDLYGLARLRLTALGVTQIHGGDLCTHADARRFYSYRRDGACGRMASLIWLK